jgi:multidrug efflux pump subunit AcrB
MWIVRIALGRPDTFIILSVLIVLMGGYAILTTATDVEHTESQSVNGVSVVKYFFQPDVDPDLSFAQITAISQTQFFYSPRGTSPPFILSYSASSVPILQLALSSESMSEAQIYDVGNTILRTQLATVAGASIPFPCGGEQRQVLKFLCILSISSVAVAEIEG